MKLRHLLLASIFLGVAAPAFAQTVSESPNPVAPGAPLTVTYSDPGAQPNDNIWIQDANGTHLQTVTLNGSTSGAITSFTAPATPGDYRIYGGFHGTAAGPADFTVSAAPPPSVPSIDMSDGSHIAPVSGDVLGVNPSGAWAPIVAPSGGSQGPAGPPGPQGIQGSPGPAGQNGTNAGQQGLFTPGSSCSVGQSGYDTGFIYLCTSPNHWAKVNIDTP